MDDLIQDKATLEADLKVKEIQCGFAADDDPDTVDILVEEKFEALIAKFENDVAACSTEEQV